MLCKYCRKAELQIAQPFYTVVILEFDSTQIPVVPYEINPIRIIIQNTDLFKIIYSSKLWLENNLPVWLRESEYRYSVA